MPYADDFSIKKKQRLLLQWIAVSDGVDRDAYSKQNSSATDYADDAARRIQVPSSDAAMCDAAFIAPESVEPPYQFTAEETIRLHEAAHPPRSQEGDDEISSMKVNANSSVAGDWDVGRSASGDTGTRLHPSSSFGSLLVGSQLSISEVDEDDVLRDNGLGDPSQPQSAGDAFSGPKSGGDQWDQTGLIDNASADASEASRTDGDQNDWVLQKSKMERY